MYPKKTELSTHNTQHFYVLYGKLIRERNLVCRPSACLLIASFKPRKAGKESFYYGMNNRTPV